MILERLFWWWRGRSGTEPQQPQQIPGGAVGQPVSYHVTATLCGGTLAAGEYALFAAAEGVSVKAFSEYDNFVIYDNLSRYASAKCAHHAATGDLFYGAKSADFGHHAEAACCGYKAEIIDMIRTTTGDTPIIKATLTDQDGNPFVVSPGATVRAALIDSNSLAGGVVTMADTITGADWANGIVALLFPNTETSGWTPGTEYRIEIEINDGGVITTFFINDFVTVQQGYIS